MDGAELAEGEIKHFVDGLASGAVSGGQVAAFAMAVFFRGMRPAETVALTLAMRDSGAVLDWRALGVEGPVLDKHSTGGVGDKVSLILANRSWRACGASVPMISGRGLGHTGGTLDKMDAIPGYQSQPSREKFADAVRAAGCAIVGATDDLAPADRRFLRDPRRDRDGREPAPHHGVDPVEEARGRREGAGAGREGRQRRVS